jgi:hypothetical protein
VERLHARASRPSDLMRRDLDLLIVIGCLLAALAILLMAPR